jgi:hypothetical protein
MRFGHPKTQEVFEGLSSNAQSIIRNTVYEQKSGLGLAISRLPEAVREGDPYIAINEILGTIQEGVDNVFEIRESKIGPVLRVKHPQKPQEQLREEATAFYAAK